MQQLRQSNVLCLHRGQPNICLQLATPDDWAAGVQNSVAGPRLGSTWFVAGGRAMPNDTKVGVIVHFEALVTFWVHRDPLRPRGLEILNQVDYHVSM